MRADIIDSVLGAAPLYVPSGIYVWRVGDDHFAESAASAPAASRTDAAFRAGSPRAP